ncbi:TPA: YadA-like family protein [Neisseria cinerea]
MGFGLVVVDKEGKRKEIKEGVKIDDENTLDDDKKSTVITVEPNNDSDEKPPKSETSYLYLVEGKGVTIDQHGRSAKFSVNTGDGLKVDEHNKVIADTVELTVANGKVTAPDEENKKKLVNAGGLESALNELGWRLKAGTTTSTVKSGEEVEFKGEGGVTVTSETDSTGKHIVTIKAAQPQGGTAAGGSTPVTAGDGISVSKDNKVSVNAKTGGGITVDANGVSVHAKDKGGLTVGTDGVSVDTDGTTIAVDTATGKVSAVTGTITAGNKASVEDADKDKLAKAGEVADAINAAKTVVTNADNTTKVELDADGKTYKVAAKVADGKGLDKTTNGLAVKQGSGITVDASGVSVNAKTNGGIKVDGDGVSVNAKTDGGIKVDATGVSVNAKTDGGITVGADGVSVHAKDKGGITVDGEGVSVNTDGTTIAVDTATGKVSAVTGGFTTNTTTGATEAKTGDGNKLATVSNVASAINAAKTKVVAGNGADVSHNEATNTYTVSAKVASDKGLESGAAGLSVKAGDGVTVDNKGVSVKSKTNGGITVDADGVSVQNGNGITVDASGVSVKAKDKGGLTVGTDGVSVDTDGTTIEVGTDGKVAAKVASDKGLEKTTDGLAIKSKTNGGIKVDGEGISVNTKANGGITVGADGVSVQNGNGITVDASGVSVKAKDKGGLTVDANGVSVVTDGKTINVADGKVSAVTGTIENDAGKAKAKAGDEDKLTTVANVAEAINAAKVKVEAGNGATVAHDAATNTYTVSAKVDENKGIVAGANGLSVQGGNGVTVDASGVSVKAKANGGLTVNGDGVSVNTDGTTIKLDDTGNVSAVTGEIENNAGKAQAKTGDEAKLTTVANVVSAINEAKTKVAAKDSTTEVELDTDGRTYKVAAKVADGKGLDKTTNGLAVKQGSGITVDASGVSVNAKTGGGITVDGSGVSVDTDNTTINVANGKVSAVTGTFSKDDKTGDTIAANGDGNKLATVSSVATAINAAKVKVEAGNGVDVSHDKATNTYTVSAKVESGKGLESGAAGLSVKAGDGVTVDNKGVSVKSKTNGGITVGADGVSVQNGNGITVGADGVSVHTKDKGGLTVNGDGISVDTDGTTIEVGTDGKVTAKVASDKGLEKTADGLAIKSKANGGITVDADGVSVTTDNTTIAVDKATGKVSAVTGTIENEAGSAKAKAGDEDKLTTVANVAKAINDAKVKVVAGNGADVSHNEATNTYTVSAKVESGKGLESGAAGLSVKAGDGVTVNANGVSVHAKDKGGLTVGTDGVSVNTDGTTIAVDKATGKVSAVTGTIENEAGSAKAKAGDEDKLTTVANVVSAINEAKTKVAAKDSTTEVELDTDGKTYKVAAKVADAKGLEKTDSGLAVKAGNGIEVGSDGVKVKVKDNGGITVDKDGLSVDLPFTRTEEPDGTMVTFKGKPAADRPNGEVRIGGVAAGMVTPTSTDAVNGSQLYAVSSRVDRLQDKVDKLGKRADAGVAGALATANLLQPHHPGQSVATAAVGNHNGQTAIAVGYATMSDNGKYGMRFSFGANSQHDVSLGAGLGYFW